MTSREEFQAYARAAIAEQREFARKHAGNREGRPAQTTGALTAAETERLLRHKQHIERFVRGFARRKGWRPDAYTQVGIQLSDGTPVRWKFWPAFGKREYLPFEEPTS